MLGRVAAVSGMAGTVAAPAALSVLPAMSLADAAWRRLQSVAWLTGVLAAVLAGMLAVAIWHAGWSGAAGAALWAGAAYPVAVTAGGAFGSGRPVAATVLGNVGTVARLAALPFAARAWPGSVGGLVALAVGGGVSAIMAGAMHRRPTRSETPAGVPAAALTSLSLAVWMASDVPIASRVLPAGGAALWAVLASSAKAPGWLTGPAWNAAAGRRSVRVGWLASSVGFLVGCTALLVVGPVLTGLAGAVIPGWESAAVGAGALAGVAAYGVAATAARGGRHAWMALAAAPAAFALALRIVPGLACIDYLACACGALVATVLLASTGGRRLVPQG